MSFNEKLADRIREVLEDTDSVTEKKMFGGIAFMVNGNMFVGVIGDKLMIRFDKTANDLVLKQKHTAPMDFTKKPMKGYAYVLPVGTKSAADLKKWVMFAHEYVSGLPKKK